MKYNLLVILAVFAAANAYSGSIYCSGKIDNSYISSNGNVIIKGRWRDSWTKICNLNEDDTVTCSMWASYVAAAVQNDLRVTVNYQTAEEYTCSNLPTYENSPTPKYIMVRNPTEQT